jgi:hypothetical protein
MTVAGVAGVAGMVLIALLSVEGACFCPGAGVWGIRLGAIACVRKSLLSIAMDFVHCKSYVSFAPPVGGGCSLTLEVL